MRLSLVTPSSRFLYDDRYTCMITRYGPFSKVLWDMRIAMEVACIGHREIDKCSINPGQRAYCTIGCKVSPCKVGLSKFKETRKKGMEEGRLSRISFSEGLVPNIESSLFRLANVEISHNDADGFRVRRPMRNDESSSFT